MSQPNTAGCPTAVPFTGCLLTRGPGAASALTPAADVSKCGCEQAAPLAGCTTSTATVRAGTALFDPGSPPGGLRKARSCHAPLHQPPKADLAVKTVAAISAHASRNTSSTGPLWSS